MAWEWVAPVATGVSGTAGVVFTWLAGAQGRRHAERMVEQTQTTQNRTRLLKERRDAYLAALRCIDLRMRRERYLELGRPDKLQLVEEHWPKAVRIQMEMDAIIAVRAFGSAEVVALGEKWVEALQRDDDEAEAELADQLRAQIRQELHENALHPQRFNGPIGRVRK